MQLSAKDAWKRILDEAHRELPDHTIRTWLEPTEAIALDEGRLIVGAPDQFAVEWNESKHATLLSKLAEPVIGQPTSVVFRVHEDRQKRPQMDFFVAPSPPAAIATPVNPSTQPLNERYTFDTFVIGKSNELAAAAAHAAAESPGKTYNPLFIYGATGLGKTHLMQAIAHPCAAPARDAGCSTSAPSSSSTKSSRASTAGRCPSSGAATGPTWTSSWWTTCISWKARR
jgi:chromosomal replication initiator protein